jgi:hypothetical protein
MQIQWNSDVVIPEDCNVGGWIIRRIMWESFQISGWNVNEKQILYAEKQVKFHIREKLVASCSMLIKKKSWKYRFNVCEQAQWATMCISPFALSLQVVIEYLSG